MHPNSTRPDDSKGTGPENYAKWLGIGVEFCGVVGVLCYIGHRLDAVLGTDPWLLVAGFFIGFTGMLYIIIKQALNTKAR